MKKRSQMEIMGLAIVIILLLLGLVFVVRFVMLKNPSGVRPGFVPSQLASNTLYSFLNSNVEECSGIQISELLRICAQGRSVNCGSIQIGCDYIEEKATFIFNQTLDKWNYEYHFEVHFKNGDTLIELGTPCPAEKTFKNFPTPTSSGTLYTDLEICH